jgi:hypothetical protein
MSIRKVNYSMTVTDDEGCSWIAIYMRAGDKWLYTFCCIEKKDGTVMSVRNVVDKFLDDCLGETGDRDDCEDDNNETKGGS